MLLVVKQHGGETGTGAVCAEITREVHDAGVKVNYDAGNVMDYLKIDPLPDIKKCADEVRSFCIKDHRRFSEKKDEDCGPGFGEIDHYKLLDNVAFTGLTVDKYWHALWVVLPPQPRGPGEDRRSAVTVKELAHVPGTPHPLLGADGRPPDREPTPDGPAINPARDWAF